MYKTHLSKFSLIAVLSMLLVGLLAACGDSTATSAPAPTTTSVAPTVAATTASATTTTAAAKPTTAVATTAAASPTTATGPVTTGAAGGNVISACTAASAAATGGKSFKVGIAVQATIPALDNAIKGFKKGMTDCGFVEGKNITYSLGNAQNDLPSLKTIGDKFRDDKVDLIVAVGTQALINMYNTNPNGPIIFNSVTNPYAALKDVLKSPTDHGAVTGIQAFPPVKEALGIIKQVVPNAKKVGLVWTTSEANSKVTTDTAKEEAPKIGLEIVEAGITKSADVKQGAESIADKVDVFLSTTDVSVVDSLESLVQVAIASKKPIISNDPSSAPRGATVAYGIDYFNNGVSSARLASRILNGEAANKVDIEQDKEFGLVVNLEAASLMGVTLPDAILSRASIKYDKITPKK